jgi:2,3-bisphosphoglycerate-independent phosphoglycerate mutase
MSDRTPFVLLIRDGWGENPHPEHDAFNAVTLAKTPIDDAMRRDWPWTLIKTSGEDVGLGAGMMGNSEVGHQNIGAGRVVDQDAVRISKAVREGRLADNETLTDAIGEAQRRGKRVHLMGIGSDAGVHGLLEHLYGLVGLCKAMGQDKVSLHLFTDGRDSSPFAGRGYIEQIEAKLGEIGVGRVASVIGRYWAMDRDNRWERTSRAYGCLTGHRSKEAGVGFNSSACGAVQTFYDNPASGAMRGDEFVPPTMIGPDRADAMGTRIAAGDTVIYYNYRGDRPRQLVSAFVLPAFEGQVAPSPDTGAKGFDRGSRLDITFVMMTPYSKPLAEHARVAFDKPAKMDDIFGSWLSTHGLTQFRCAETEKYAHVTFFFNDYREEPFEGEHRALLQSPRVATYDETPEMSAAGICEAVLGRLASEECEDVLIVNFANPDMIGHTGNLDAVVKACETVDACVGRIIEAVLARDGSLIVTADHGNAEQMKDPATDMPHTSHTTYDVPLFVVGERFRSCTLAPGGRLGDIAPTALAMMGVEQPGAMTGHSLIGSR